MRRLGGGGWDRRTRQRVLRVVLTVLAVALGTVAVWLIVTSESAQRTKIGALAGFWALLIAAYPVLGMRHPQSEQVGQELDLRPAGNLERTEDAAARVEYERRLQQMIRHEIHTALGSELASLRSEVAALRSEILEKVGGQIRLERIETTRMIGSDIEALQHEVRQLKVANGPDGMGGFTVDATELVQSMDDAVARQLAAAEAEHAERLRQLAAHVAEVELAEVEHSASASEAAPTPEPMTVAMTPVVAPTPSVDVPHAPHLPSDPFAAMPHVTPFADMDGDGAEATDAGYAGRRRSAGEGSTLPGGRHAGGEADWATARPEGGRRRRRDDDDGADILAEILRREGQRS